MKDKDTCILSVELMVSKKSFGGALQRMNFYLSLSQKRKHLNCFENVKINISDEFFPFYSKTISNIKKLRIFLVENHILHTWILYVKTDAAEQISCLTLFL